MKLRSSASIGAIIVVLLGISATYQSYDTQIKAKVDELKNLALQYKASTEATENELSSYYSQLQQLQTQIEGMKQSIDNANAEELGQLEYISNAINEVSGGSSGSGSGDATVNGGGVTTKEQAWNNLSTALANDNVNSSDIAKIKDGSYIIKSTTLGYMIKDNYDSTVKEVSETTYNLYLTWSNLMSN